MVDVMRMRMKTRMYTHIPYRRISSVMERLVSGSWAAMIETRYTDNLRSCFVNYIILKGPEF
jgi:hypothetical protein